MKRFVMLALCLVLAFSLGVIAFGADYSYSYADGYLTGSITSKGTNPEVWVNGELKGGRDLKIKVSAGTYQIDSFMDGKALGTTTITVKNEVNEVPELDVSSLPSPKSRTLFSGSVSVDGAKYVRIAVTASNTTGDQFLTVQCIPVVEDEAEVYVSVPSGFTIANVHLVGVSSRVTGGAWSTFAITQPVFM